MSFVNIDKIELIEETDAATVAALIDKLMERNAKLVEREQMDLRIIDDLHERNAKLVAALETAKDCIRSGSSDDFPLTRLENETIQTINDALSQFAAPSRRDAPDNHPTSQPKGQLR